MPRRRGRRFERATVAHTCPVRPCPRLRHGDSRLAPVQDQLALLEVPSPFDVSKGVEVTKGGSVSSTACGLPTGSLAGVPAAVSSDSVPSGSRNGTIPV